MSETLTTGKSILLSPLTIRGQTFKNRIGVSPMTQLKADNQGFVGDWHLMSAGSYASGGAGLVMMEGTGVEPMGRISNRSPGMWRDEHMESMARIARFVRSQGSVAGIQLVHSGPKAGWLFGHMETWEGLETVSASAIPYCPGATLPKQATEMVLIRVREAFVSAALRSVRAGFQVIELHFGHGYLISSFLSPITNHRLDDFGGSLENRMRFGLSVARSVRNALPDDIVLGVRVSVTDYCDNGWDLQQTIEFAKQLKQIGIDFLDCSSGDIIHNAPYNPLNPKEGVHVESAGTIRRETGLATVAVGKIVDPLEAEKILETTGAAFVLIGRAFVNNPHWPFLAADALGDDQPFKHSVFYDWAVGLNKGLYKWRQTVFSAKQ
ncbi:unnamed protein product [Oppiella nova]|uniref:NADH:flavin oxidoreductase/NADH oxidase N-terminal domain-containing protein n=1 Tax=Oppiella nova TaxID=334625 RepID=A0A7R9QJ85_9ACAR|nr:unnamed protein product [Oppiella nova]CAG2166931.1 unnamed protein product [Oppiella nova]